MFYGNEENASPNANAPLSGIPKLNDAYLAGSSKGQLCTLILVEGNSAKLFAVACLAAIGRDKHGILPLHGSNFINVCRATDVRIMKNESVQNIVVVMGLTFDKVYTDVNSLRNGSILIMADADHDGSHLKGLIMNFFLLFWPSLLQLEGFLKVSLC
jgi:DNA topoisomerase-2